MGLDLKRTDGALYLGKAIERDKIRPLETQNKNQKKDQIEGDKLLRLDELVKKQIVHSPLNEEKDPIEKNDLFLEKEIFEEELKNDFEGNQQLKNSKRRAKTKSNLKRMFSKKSYRWVKRISSKKGINSERDSLSFYPWGLWKGQYLDRYGEMKKISFKIKKKKHEFKDLVNLNIKVGKGSNFYLAISKNLKIKITNNKEFLNLYDYFSFCIDKELVLILFKKKKEKAFKGMIKFKKGQKEKILGTFRVKKVNKKQNL
tara:strand:- start:687 stop:1460 length:774 start_codon:yes stop_codon:yes gene_type:complete